MVSSDWKVRPTSSGAENPVHAHIAPLTCVIDPPAPSVSNPHAACS
jgi:hypothetical protein